LGIEKKDMVLDPREHKIYGNGSASQQVSAPVISRQSLARRSEPGRVGLSTLLRVREEKALCRR
jgi:hypothetical protein